MVSSPWSDLDCLFVNLNDRVRSLISDDRIPHIHDKTFLYELKADKEVPAVTQLLMLHLPVPGLVSEEYRSMFVVTLLSAVHGNSNYLVFFPSEPLSHIMT